MNQISIIRKYKIELLSRKYCIKVPLKDFESLMSYDNQIGWENFDDVELFEKLDNIIGVSDVNYNNRFSNRIFFELENDHDNLETWDTIETTIENHINKVKEHLDN